MASSPHEKTVLLEGRVKKPMPGPSPEVGTATKDDHVFHPPSDRPWDRCTVCGLSQASHTDPGDPYVPDSKRAVRESG